MFLNVMVFAGLLAVNSPSLPPRPDLAALIPPTSDTLLGRIRDTCNPLRREAHLLAGYLNRMWCRVALQEPDFATETLMTIISQFDCAIMNLNPNPTMSEAAARVRAYQLVMELMRQKIIRTRANPKPFTDELASQLRDSLYRMNWRIEHQYYPVFARFVWYLTFGK